MAFSWADDKTHMAPLRAGLKKGELAIIGTGFGRTGTGSLKIAFETLGFGPTHHMVEVFRFKQVKLWMDAAEGKEPDWDTIFAEFSSTCDFPGCSFYKELMEKYPDAVVVLTVRDSPEAWYTSVKETIFQGHIQGRSIPSRFVSAVVPSARTILRFLDSVWLKQFGSLDVFKDKETLMAAYTAHIEEVKRTVPPEKLLVFNVKQVCVFLFFFLVFSISLQKVL